LRRVLGRPASGTYRGDHPAGSPRSFSPSHSYRLPHPAETTSFRLQIFQSPALGVISLSKGIYFTTLASRRLSSPIQHLPSINFLHCPFLCLLRDTLVYPQPSSTLPPTRSRPYKSESFRERTLLMSSDLRAALNCLRHPSRFMPVSRSQLSKVHTGDSIQNLSSI
jgi:hypothetical protein